LSITGYCNFIHKGSDECDNACKELITCHLKTNNFDQAGKEIDYSINLIRRHSLIVSPVEILSLKAQLKVKLGQTDEAHMLYDSIIGFNPIAIELAEANVGKGFAYIIHNSNLQEAEKAYVTAKKVIDDNSILDKILLSKLLDLYGRIKWHTGEFEAALEQFRLALAHCISVFGVSHPDVGAIYANMGIMYKNLLQYDKALEYYTLSLNLRKKFLGVDHLEVANSYNNIGYLLYKKDLFEDALTIHQKALNIRKVQLSPSHSSILQSLEHIGLCYGGMGQFREAEKYFKSILNARIEKYGINNHWVGYAYYNLGAIAVEDQDYHKAADYFSIAIEIGKVVYGPYNYDQADNYNRLANCYLKLNETGKAQQNFQLALQHNLPEYDWEGDVKSVPEVNYYLSFREALRSLIGLANSFANGQVADEIVPSISFIIESENLIKKFKRNFSKDSDLLSISSSSKQLADCANKIYYKLNELNPNHAYKEEIFRYSELAKGSALLSKLNAEKAIRISDIPEDLLKTELLFKNKQDSLNNLILNILNEDKHSPELDAIKTQLFETNRSYESFIDLLEANYPKYTLNKYGIDPVKIQRVQQFLSNSESRSSVIQYNYSEQNDLTISIITSEEHRVVQLKSLELVDKIQLLRQAIQEPGKEDFRAASFELFKELIAPIEDFLVPDKHLVIIPDGIIGFVPFDILLRRPEGEDYLLFSHSITYDLSATLFVSRVPQETNGNSKLLSYAPKFEQVVGESVPLDELIVRSDILNPLPGAEDEARKVSEIMEGDLRLGESATEALFKKEAGSYDILHLATHSIINQEDPNYSKLMFSDKDDSEDGMLHAFELENMSLNATLVTLSACNTGVGKIEEGEGVMSMARAFRSAGVPSVVMSLWPASDKSTPDLMKYFYQNLNNGQSKDVALNHARKQYLETATGKARHPFYWGGFVLIGDNQPIKIDRNPMIWMLPIALLMVVMLAIAYNKRRRI
ncbi:MAG: CHAT domain-containing protein, partial [Bacteroidetes bacterium]|nr:CHAT domain-containing protein [Bacteroidota bacterium]